MKTVFKFILLGLCFIPLGIYPEEAPSPPVCRDIPVESYFTVLSSLVKEAKQSILIVLSNFSCAGSEAQDPVMGLVKELVLANMEGVEITLVLNEKFAYGTAREKTPGSTGDPGLDLLKSSKVKICFIDNKTNISVNWVLIDRALLLECSFPWISGLELPASFTSCTLITSGDLVRQRAEKIQKLLPQSEDKTSENPEEGKYLLLPSTLFEKNLPFRFISWEIPSLVDFYFYLLFKNALRDTIWFSIQIDEVGSRLFPSLKTRKELTDQILYNLKKLASASLLKYKKEKDGNLYVSLERTEKKFRVPLAYFIYNYSSILSLEEKMLYFTMLYESSLSGCYPRINLDEKLKSFFKKWKPDYQELLAGKLEKALLIQPYNKEPREDGVKQYELLEPPNRMALKKSLEMLKLQYGEAHFGSAQLIASQLNKELDPNVLSDILYYEKQLGALEVQKAFHLVCELPPNHPDRVYRTVKKTLAQVLNERLKVAE